VSLPSPHVCAERGTWCTASVAERRLDQARDYSESEPSSHIGPGAATRVGTARWQSYIREPVFAYARQNLTQLAIETLLVDIATHALIPPPAPSTQLHRCVGSMVPCMQLSVRRSICSAQMLRDQPLRGGLSGLAPSLERNPECGTHQTGDRNSDRCGSCALSFHLHFTPTTAKEQRFVHTS